MPDNIGYTPGVGATVAADEIGGVIFQRLKLVIGGDGVNGGDVAVGNPLPVVGAVTTDGLTDAELRAAPVPVSGPLTDAQLRAVPVPVSGTVTTGGLTDAQLRATAVPVKENSTATFNNGAETVVAAVAVSVLAANASRKFCIIQNTGTRTVRLGAVGVTATTGVRLDAGASLVFTQPYVPTNALYAIRDGGPGTTTILAQEGT